MGIVIGALAYAAGRLPKRTDLTTHYGTAVFTHECSVARKEYPRKPSGAVTYKVSKGSNVWPTTAASDKALVRVLDGELVIFQDFQGDDKVAVSVGGLDRVLPRTEWRALPVYEG